MSKDFLRAIGDLRVESVYDKGDRPNKRVGRPEPIDDGQEVQSQIGTRNEGSPSPNPPGGNRLGWFLNCS